MTAVPFPSNPRRPTSSPASGISPEAPSPPRGTMAALQAISAPPTQEAWRDHLARFAELAPEQPEPDIPAAWWAPLFWLGAIMLGAAIWTAVVCAILYFTRSI